MFKRLTVLSGILLATAAIATIAVEPTTVMNVAKTWRGNLRREVRQHLTDTAVELDTVVQQVKERLPRDIAMLRDAIADADRQMTTQDATLQELNDTERHVIADLGVLAGPVEQGKGVQVKGRFLQADEARREATRLLARKRDYDTQIAAHNKLVKGLRQHRSELQRRLEEAESMARDLAAKVKMAQNNAQLLQATRSLAKLREGATSLCIGDAPATLDQISRDIQRQLSEINERSRLFEAIQAPDEQCQAVRDERMLSDLKAFVPPDIPTIPSMPEMTSPAPSPALPEPGANGLTITEPVADAHAARHLTVSGTWSGPGPARVELIVLAPDGCRYKQDQEVDIASGSEWRLNGVVLGRIGQADSGQTFLLQARAHTPEGKCIELTPIKVTRN